MGDDPKSKPLDDLKEGLGLIFRAAKGAVERLPTDKVEDVAKDAVKQVGSAFETIGSEVDKLWNKATGSGAPPVPPAAPPPAEAAAEPPKPPEEPQHYDDAYAPEPPPKGPRVG
jgi:hypothetical protein